MLFGGTSECARLIWNTEDDNLVRHLAKKMSMNELGLFKACSEVLDRYEEWWKEIPIKIK